ncbi:MAG: tyrosine-type recombinase/integrase [Rhizomicrobium sp.]
MLKMLIPTGQRQGEIPTLLQGMVGGDTITVPSAYTKNGCQHVVPLGSMTKRILGRTQPQGVPYFPARQRTTPFSRLTKCTPKPEKRCDLSDWTLHDLRRTFASGLAAQGVPLPVTGRLLDHASGGFGEIFSVYERYDFMLETKIMFGPSWINKYYVGV